MNLEKLSIDLDQFFDVRAYNSDAEEEYITCVSLRSLLENHDRLSQEDVAIILLSVFQKSAGFELRFKEKFEKMLRYKE